MGVARGPAQDGEVDDPMAEEESGVLLEENESSDDDVRLEDITDR